MLGLRLPGGGRVVEDVEPRLARRDHVVVAVLVDIDDPNLHPYANGTDRRRVAILFAGIPGQVVEREYVTHKLAAGQIVPKGEHRLVAGCVASIVGEEPFAGYQVGFAVAVQIAQGHGVELAEVGLDPVKLEAPSAVAVGRLLQPCQPVGVGGADNDVVQPVGIDVVHQHRVACRGAGLRIADRMELVLRVERPLLLRGLLGAFVPSNRRDDVGAAVAVYVTQTVAVCFAFGADHVLDEPGRPIDRLVPGHALAFDQAPMIAQDIIVAVAVDVAVNDSLHAPGRVEPGGLPLHVLLETLGTGVLIPESALHQHPAGADHIRVSVAVDVHCEFAVVVDLRTVRGGAVAEVLVLLPRRGFVPVAARGQVQVSVAVEVGHRGTLRERPEPVAVVGRIVNRSIDPGRYEDRLGGLKRCGQKQDHGCEKKADVFH